jgi:integrase
MVDIQRALTKEGFSLKAAEVISQAHRPSTRGLYNNKWTLFSKYCVVHKIKRPDKASICQVADFLLFLRQTRKLKASTICTYLAGISSVLTYSGGVKMSTRPELLAILKNFKVEDRKTASPPPKWDLNIVMRHLRSKAYEPLGEKSMEILSHKTLFLIALATAARLGEIHAIDIHRISFDKKGTAFLQLEWGFLAKNQDPGEPDRSYIIPSLRPLLGRDDKEDYSTCPVRALKYYMKKSQDERGKRRRLFIPLKKKESEISRTELSFWMRNVILKAYAAEKLAPPASINLHETRAIASTMALHSNCSLSDIMQGCFWKSQSVFSSHYLRDVEVVDKDEIMKMGPVVFAQRVSLPATRRF